MSTESQNNQLHGDLALGENPPAASNPKTEFYTEEVEILDGAVKLMRTKQSNKIWQMRVWVSDEKRHFRKSMRTRDLDLAKEKARKTYYQMMGQRKLEIRYFQSRWVSVLRNIWSSSNKGWMAVSLHKVDGQQFHRK